MVLYTSNAVFTCTFPGTVPCDTLEMQVKPIAPDKKSVIAINNGAPDSVITLNVGDTLINVGVTSPDGSNTQVKV